MICNRGAQKHHCEVWSNIPVNDDKNNKIAEQYCSLSLKEKSVVFGIRLADYKYYDLAQTQSVLLN